MRPLRVLLITVGSHGDVHPFIGIGLGLARRGHHVTLATNSHFQPLIERAGLNFESTGSAEKFLNVLENPDIWRGIRGLRTVLSAVAVQSVEPIYTLIERWLENGEGLIVAHALALGARVAEEKLGARLATVQLAPSSIRSTLEMPIWPGLRWLRPAPGWMKQSVLSLLDRVIVDPIIAPAVNAFRSRLALAPVRGIVADWWNSRQRVLGLFPEWFAAPPADWPSQVRLCGFPLYDERELEPLPTPLIDFLESTPETKPIVAFTPGSANVQASRFFATSSHACELVGCRGLLLTRHPAQIPRSLSNDVRHVAFAPFSQLLPRVSAIVHHGGIGTTAQSLAAGCPQLVMPLAYDQLDNGDRVRRLNCGRVIAAKNYRAKAVARHLRAILESEQIKSSAQMVAGRFAGENGVTVACNEIEAMAREGSQR